jgi:hypothetical protein
VILRTITQLADLHLSLLLLFSWQTRNGQLIHATRQRLCCAALHSLWGTVMATL